MIQAELHQFSGAVRIFRQQKAVDLAPQRETGSVISKHDNPIWNPVLVDELLGAREQMTHDFENSRLANVDWSVQVARKTTSCPLVHLKKKSLFAGEVLKYGTFGDAQGIGDVYNPRAVKSILCKLASRNVKNAVSLCLGAPMQG